MLSRGIQLVIIYGSWEAFIDWLILHLRKHLSLLGSETDVLLRFRTIFSLSPFLLHTQEPCLLGIADIVVLFRCHGREVAW